MTLRTFVALAAVIASVFGAVLGLRAATIKVRDNLDAFINDLNRQGTWAAWAAVVACVAALLAGIDRLVELLIR